jgi:hypothetical protein
MRLPLGQSIRITTEVRDLSGVLADPDDTVTLYLHKPDATVGTYASPSHTTVGKYYQDLVSVDLSQLGHYSYAWVTTSVSGVAAGVSPSGDFDVYDPFEFAVLPLQDAKDALNIAQSNTAYDVEIAVMVASVERMLAQITGGPLFTATISERVKVGHGYRSLVLRQRPVVAVTSITDIASGTALISSDLDVDTNAGVIRRKLELPFWSRGPYYQVVYTAGWGTSLPAAFNLAARIVLQHLWEVQQGPGQRPTMGGGDFSNVQQSYHNVGVGYAVPNRVLELMAPYASQVSL